MLGEPLITPKNIVRKLLCFIFLTLFFIAGFSQNFIERLDLYTNEKVSYEKIELLPNGEKVAKNNCDGIIIICDGNKYYKRVLPAEGFYNIKWFGVKGDGDKNDIGTDDTNKIEQAIKILSHILPTYSLSGGNNFGGFTLYFPAGKYLVDKTIILPDNVKIIGESMQSTNIHAKRPKFIFTNIQGLAKNGVDVKVSTQLKIADLTLTQGGIELQGAVDSRIEDVRIMNLSGKNTATGLSIKSSVNTKIKNLKIFDSTGTGIIYDDSAGSGPSTTVTFEDLWVAHCQIGMVVNGLTGGSHAIIASKIYNSIFEYNRIGLKLEGNIENFAVRDSHFEQNDNGGIIISGNVTANFENVWSDGDEIILDETVSKESKIFIQNSKIKFSSGKNIFIR